jgi:hypothetical protein
LHHGSKAFLLQVSMAEAGPGFSGLSSGEDTPSISLFTFPGEMLDQFSKP